MRNFQDLTGYGSTVRDEAYGLLSGLAGGALIIALSFLGGWLS